MFSRNVEKLLPTVGKEGTTLRLDAADEITKAVVTVLAGKIVDPPVTSLRIPHHGLRRDSRSSGLYVFILATFVGYQIITACPICCTPR